MSNVPEGAQVSDDGQWWWDGENWQAVEGGQSVDPGTGDGGYSQDDSGYSDDSGYTPDDGGYSSATPNINPNEFPSLARVMYFGENVDAYLSDLGIDPAGIDNDDSPNVA